MGMGNLIPTSEELKKSFPCLDGLKAKKSEEACGNHSQPDSLFLPKKDPCGYTSRF
jgi:hypothetical protein